MLYSGFNILPRSVFWSANFNGRSDNLDVIHLNTLMAIFRKSLDKFLAQNNLDVEFLGILASLFVASKRLSIFKFDLVDPNYIFKKRDKLDQEIMFDRGLIPFGECGNGDYLVVDARQDSATSLMVCILSHDYALEHTDELDRILPEILRPISRNVASFCEEVRSKECCMPSDYFDENAKPYIPEYMKRGPKARRDSGG